MLSIFWTTGDWVRAPAGTLLCSWTTTSQCLCQSRKCEQNRWHDGGIDSHPLEELYWFYTSIISSSFQQTYGDFLFGKVKLQQRMEERWVNVDWTARETLSHFYDHPVMVGGSSFLFLLFRLKSCKPEVLIVSKTENQIWMYRKRITQLRFDLFFVQLNKIGQFCFNIYF